MATPDFRIFTRSMKSNEFQQLDLYKKRTQTGSHMLKCNLHLDLILFEYGDL